MPLLLDKKIQNGGRLALWDAKEGSVYFDRSLKMTPKEKRAYQLMKPHRQREWITSRFLIHFISGDKARTPILKTEYGKPYRKDCKRHISISHSKDKVAVVIADTPVGIDIQNEVAKISRIEHKFISDKERAHLTYPDLLPYHHIFWGAKESMYKAYGLKELDFKEHMHLYPFKYFARQLELKGYVKKEAYFAYFDVYAEKIDDDYLVYTLQSTP